VAITLYRDFAAAPGKSLRHSFDSRIAPPVPDAQPVSLTAAR
jgi:hypothetical protein